MGVAQEIGIRGAKGGGSSAKTPIEASDSLRSTNLAKILIAVGEGEFEGTPTNKDIYLDNTPIEDDSGNVNFPNVNWTWRAGSVEQSYIPGIPAVENESTINVELTASNPWVRSLTNLQLSAARVRLAWPALQKQDNEGNVGGYRIEYAIDVATDGGAYKQVLIEAVDGKSTTRYERSRRIDLPKATSGWQIRVRRITPNQNTNKIADTMLVAGLSEVIDAKIRYPNTALLYIEFDAEQFSNIPAVTVKCKARKWPVPSNYDPVSRSYSGAWDGTFKEAWTNNPAWVTYGICVNDRFGLGKRIKPWMVDKYELFRIAQYCDQMVPDGASGTEPRFLCDMNLQGKADAWSLLRDISGIYRGMTYWAHGSLIMQADIPRSQDFDYIFSRANVINGEINVSGSRAGSHYSRALISYDNPQNNYDTDVVAVTDAALQRRYRDRPVEISAIGCTRASEAMRRGKWILLTNSLDRTVTFKTGMEGRIPLPGYVIPVADKLTAGREIGGRISSVSGNTITLDRDTAAKPGDRLMLNLPNGMAEGRTIKSVAGRAITVTTAYSQAPANQLAWALDADDLGVPLYRVLSVKRSTEGEYEISAVQYNPSKFAAIDTGAKLDEIPISIIPITVVPAPASVSLTATSTIDQGIAVTTMTITWPAVSGAVAYDVEWRKDSGNWIKVQRTGTTSVEVRGIYAGAYLARARAVSAFDISSIWKSSNLTQLNGKTGTPPSVTSLTTTSLLFGIHINWTFPPGAEDTQRTEIWYGPANSLGAATKLADLAYPQSDYSMQQLKAGATLFFWARLVDRSGNIGPFFPVVDGVIGQASSDATAILDQIAGEVTKSALGKELLADIEKIDLIDSNGPGSVNNRIDEAKQELEGQVGAVADSVTTVKNSVTTVKADLAAQVTTINSKITATNAEVTGVKNDLAAQITTTSGSIATVKNDLAAQVVTLNSSITATKSNLQTQIDTVSATANALSYVASKTYAAGETVRMGQRLYQAAKSVPVNTLPPNTSYWLDVGSVVASANGLAARVTTSEAKISDIEGVNTAQATSLNGLQTALNGKADASAVTSLTSRVTATESKNAAQDASITSQGQAITGLTNVVAGKADASTVTALSNTVTQQGNAISAQGQALTTINANLGEAGGQNVLYNPSFDLAGTPTNLADGWTLGVNGSATLAASLVDSTLDPKGKVQRVDISGLSSATYADLTERFTRRPSVSEGQTYTLSVYVKGTAGLVLQMYFQPLNAGGTSVSTYTGPYATMTGAWQRVTFATSSPLPAGSVAMHVIMRMRNGSVGAGFFEFDRAQLQTGAVAAGWNDTTGVLADGVAANAVATTALTGRVDSVEDTVTSQGSAITSLTNAVANKADASAVTSLTTRVTATESKNTAQDASITSQGQAITGLTNSIAGKADASAMTALTTRVTATESKNTAQDAALGSQSQAITSLTNSVATKADSSTVSALTNTVTQQGSAISAQGDSITSINANLGSAGGDNLLPNSSFDDPLPGNPGRPQFWVASGVSSLVASPLSSSSKALRAESSALAVNAYIEATLDNSLIARPSVVAGTPYTLSVYARAGAGAFRFSMYIQFYNEAGDTVVSVPTLPETALTDTFQRLTLSGVCPAGATQAHIYAGRLFNRTGKTASGWFEVDNIQFQEGAIATAYAPSIKLASDANAAATSALTGRVSTVEGTVTSQGSALTSLTNTVAGKADAAALSSLTTRVTAAEGVNTSQGAAITSLNNTVAGKADASAVQSLTTRVTATESKNTAQDAALSSQSQAITALTNTVNGKASSTAVQALTNAVTQQGDDLDAQGKSLTSITASLEGVNAPFVASDASWEFIGTLGGWAEEGATPGVITSAASYMRLTGYANLICSFPPVDGTINPVLRLKIRRSGTTRAGCRVYWVNQDGGLSEARTAFFTIDLTTNDWQTIDIDLSGNTAWLGKSPSALRLDMVVPTDTASTLDVAYVSIGRRSAAASASALDSLSSVVTQQGDSITSLSTRATNLASAIAGKADASALAALTTRVTSAEGVNTSQASQITNLTTTVNGKADSSTVSALNNTVTQQGNTITAQGQALTNITASIGDIGGDNLLPNSSFEELADGSTTVPKHWAIGAVPSLVISPLPLSTKALRVTATAFANNASAGIVCNPIEGVSRPKVTPGEAYTLSVWARGITGPFRFAMYIEFMNAAGSAIATPALAESALTDTFQRFTLSGVAPAGAVIANIHAGRLFNRSGAATSMWMELDNVQFQEGSVATAYSPSTKLASDAQGAATSALTLTVDQQGSALTSLSSSLTNLTNTINSSSNGLATKASADAVNSLANRVSAAEGVNTSQASSISSLKSSLTGENSEFAASAASYEFKGTLNGFTASPQSGSPTLVVAPTYARLTGSGGLFRSNTVDANGTLNPYIRVRMRRSGSTRSTGSLYWANQDGGLSETRRQNFAIDITTTDWQTIEIDLSSNVQWLGKTNYALRFDMVDVSDTGAVVDYAYVSVGNKAPTASASALSALTTTVTQQGSNITSASSRVTALENSINSGTDGLATKASSKALTSLTSTVTSQGNALTAQTARIDGLYTSVGSANSAIQTEANARASADSAQASQITSLQSVVNSQGDALGVNSAAIQSEAWARASGLASLASRVDGVQATAGSASANAQTALTASANLRNDVSAQYSVKLMTMASGQKVAAGFGIGIESEGQISQSTFAVSADRFVVLNANLGGGGALFSPFAIDGGQVFINDAFIKNASIGAAKIGDGAITNAKIGNAEITAAKIGVAEIDTLRIRGNAVTVPTSSFQPAQQSGSGMGAWQASIAIGITMDEAGYIQAQFSCTQNFGFGVRGYGFRMTINGQTMTEFGGTWADGFPNLAGSIAVAPGYFVIQVDWYGQDAGVTIANKSLYVLGVKR